MLVQVRDRVEHLPRVPPRLHFSAGCARDDVAEQLASLGELRDHPHESAVFREHPEKPQQAARAAGLPREVRQHPDLAQRVLHKRFGPAGGQPEMRSSLVGLCESDPAELLERNLLHGDLDVTLGLAPPVLLDRPVEAFAERSHADEVAVRQRVELCLGPEMAQVRLAGVLDETPGRAGGAGVPRVGQRRGSRLVGGRAGGLRGLPPRTR
mmetsp:Transcript_13439/g.35663  ORF Transcript_13439/g.35663 Transcript_13439/m.35663 type:complete len:210 (+) Transcript_13439:801-1430(+)